MGKGKGSLFNFREINEAKMMVYILKPVVLYEKTGLYALYDTLMLFPITTDNWEILSLTNPVHFKLHHRTKKHKEK